MRHCPSHLDLARRSLSACALAGESLLQCRFDSGFGALGVLIVDVVRRAWDVSEQLSWRASAIASALPPMSCEQVEDVSSCCRAGHPLLSPSAPKELWSLRTSAATVADIVSDSLHPVGTQIAVGEADRLHPVLSLKMPTRPRVALADVVAADVDGRQRVADERRRQWLLHRQGRCRFVRDRATAACSPVVDQCR